MAVKTRDVIEILERIAPPEWAESWDRVGLQVGGNGTQVRKILTALELTDDVLDEVVTERSDLLILHHPPIFEPLTGLRDSNPIERRLATLVRKKISVYVTHTNFDACELSMSARMLRDAGVLNPRRVLSKPSVGKVKIVVFTPLDAVDKVRAAMASEGAGTIGEYDMCSFCSTGKGSFLGSEASSPSVGKRGRLEEVDEGRLEMICPKDHALRVLSAMVEAHPYEEPAVDVYHIEDFRNPGHYLWVGELPKPTRLADLAKPGARAVGDPSVKVRCSSAASGAGKSLLRTVVSLGVDAFLTGEIGHHDARLAEDLGIPVIQLGHYESEVAFGSIVANLLRRRLRGRGVTIHTSRRLRHPWI